MMSSGGYDLKGALEDLKANWYGASEDGQTAAQQAQREPPRVKPEGEREVGTCAINSPLSESLSDSYVDVGLQDEAELLGSNPPAATTEGAQLTASVSSTTGSGSLLATVAGVIAATGKSVAVAAAKSAGLCGDVSSGQKDRGEPPEKGKKEAGEEEEAPLQDEYVKVDSSMHQGHVNVRVIKQGWLKKQVFRVIDGRPNWRRHFVRWKQRYFVLSSDGCLKYYADAEMQKFVRCIRLAGMEVTRHFYASESTEEAGRCFIIRPKQRPQSRLRRLVSQRDQEEEIKFLSGTPEEMEEWLQAIKAEIESSEEQGQTIFKAAWGSLKSLFLERQQSEDEGSGGAASFHLDDFVPVSPGGPPPEEELGNSEATGGEGGQQQETRRRSSSVDFGGSAAAVSDLILATPTVPIPRMSIVIMVVGTQGDVQPFLVVGKLLQKNGHRVRLATHELYRPLVRDAGLEFYPLGGDPKKLSAFMVKTSGRIFPKLYDHEEMLKDVPEQMAMLTDIIRSTWPACTAADPLDPLARPFIADAIISNPVSYGHIHCAEALSVPLHIMFPQPWSPTKAFPHPLSGLPYSGRWCKENWYSYIVVDKFLWFGIRDMINHFRTDTLGLEPIRLGEHGGDLLNDNKVPFAKMWSPSLVPKPKDWGPHIDVVGNIFPDQDPAVQRYTPAVEFESWLSEGPAPIFVGFGSMVIEDTARLVRMIVDASLRTTTRVVLQSSWSDMLAASADGPLPASVFALGSCPHDWLFPRMQAVIHHGGAGTVAAGLRAGKPTMVVAHFGDQHFWGYMVHQARVGVLPVPVGQLTADRLAEAFVELKSPRLTQAAQDMARAFAAEDGAKEAVKVFYRHLPVEDMVCDVSLFTSRPLVARRYCQTCRLKLSLEADAVIHQATATDGSTPHETHDYFFVNWGVVGPQHAADGLVQGLTSATHEVIGAVTGVVREPVMGAHKSGVRGAAKGVAKGLLNLVRRPIRGAHILVNKVSIGVTNSLQAAYGETTGEGGGRPGPESPRPRRSAFYANLWHIQSRLYNLALAQLLPPVNQHKQLQPETGPWPPEDEDLDEAEEAGDASNNKDGGAVNRHRLWSRRRKQLLSTLSESYAEELRQGHQQAMRCRELFVSITKGNPLFATKECVLRLAERDLGDVFSPALGGKDQSLSRELLDRIDSVGDGRISFQQFCVFVKALQELQQQAVDEEERARHPRSWPDVEQALNSIIYDSVFLEDQHQPQPPPEPLPAMPRQDSLATSDTEDDDEDEDEPPPAQQPVQGTVAPGDKAAKLSEEGSQAEGVGVVNDGEEDQSQQQQQQQQQQQPASTADEAIELSSSVAAPAGVVGDAGDVDASSPGSGSTGVDEARSDARAADVPTGANEGTMEEEVAGQQHDPSVQGTEHDLVTPCPAPMPVSGEMGGSAAVAALVMGPEDAMKKEEATLDEMERGEHTKHEAHAELVSPAMMECEKEGAEHEGEDVVQQPQGVQPMTDEVAVEESTCRPGSDVEHVQVEGCVLKGSEQMEDEV